MLSTCTGREAGDRREAGPRSPRRWILLWTRLAAGLALFLSLGLAFRPSEILAALSGFHPLSLIPFSACVALEIGLSALSLYPLARRASPQPLSFRQLFGPYLYCWILGSLTPVRVGDFALPETLGRPAARGPLLAAVLVQKLVALAVLGSASVLSLLLGAWLPNAWEALAVCGGLLVAASILVRYERVRRAVRQRVLRRRAGRLAGFGWMLESLLCARGALVLSGLATLGRVFTGPLVLSVLLLGLGHDPMFLRTLCAGPLVRLVSFAPITILGLGVQEGAWILLLAPAGVPGSAILASHVIARPATLALGLAGLLLVGRLGRQGSQRPARREGNGEHSSPWQTPVAAREERS